MCTQWEAVEGSMRPTNARVSPAGFQVERSDLCVVGSAEMKREITTFMFEYLLFCPLHLLH